MARSSKIWWLGVDQGTGFDWIHKEIWFTSHTIFGLETDLRI